MEDYLITCFSKQYFAFPCPSCGGQRAVLLLLNGQIKESFLMYPGLFPLLLFGGSLALSLFVSRKVIRRATNILGIVTALTVAVSYLIKIYTIFF